MRTAFLSWDEVAGSVKLTIHTKVKIQWSYTSTPPICMPPWGGKGFDP